MNAVSRARLLSVAVLAVVFASGIVVGFAWDRRLDAAEIEALQATGGQEGAEAEPSAEGEATERRRRPMYEQVEPTEAQRVQIDSIVEAYRQDVRSFHRESRRSYDEGMRARVLQAREAIKSVLTPDQAARYDSLSAAADARSGGGERDQNRDQNRDRN